MFVPEHKKSQKKGLKKKKMIALMSPSLVPVSSSSKVFFQDLNQFKEINQTTSHGLSLTNFFLIQQKERSF